LYYLGDLYSKRLDMLILHKFRDHQVAADTEILILGTFSGDTEEGTDFFYGRSRNFLWHLLPQCWAKEPLKEAGLEEKKRFMAEHKIDFADLIHAIDVPEGEEKNVDDAFIDSQATEWKNIIQIMKSLSNLKAVYFTRKTFNGIPNAKRHLAPIVDYCRQMDIRICKLETPAKFYSPEKLQQWKDTIVSKKTCLKP
jgi:G:T/U-mismatch repair DNA glycosylase